MKKLNSLQQQSKIFCRYLDVQFSWILATECGIGSKFGMAFANSIPSALRPFMDDG
jgi:hypothetical protein